MGWDLCRHGMRGPTFPFSFPRHPPNLFVLPRCLPGRPRNFPCSEHGASHLHLMSVFVLVLAPVLAGIVMQPSPGVPPTPELSLLAAVAGGMGAGGPRGCGVGVLSCTRLAGGVSEGSRMAAASTGERATKNQPSSACLSASAEAEQGNDHSL